MIEHSFSPTGQADDKPCQFDVSKIGNSVTLIGRLGRPLGTKMQIKGVWMDHADFEAPRFSITQVDGVKLAKPIVFYKEQVQATTKGTSVRRPYAMVEDLKSFNAFSDYDNSYSYSSLIGEEWTMMAYETGFIDKTPIDFESGTVPFSRAPWSSTFTPELVGVVILKDVSAKKVDQASDKPCQIDVSKIGSSVTLIGRLGRPLGKEMQIKGTWVADKVKGELPRFSISQVDGVKLAKPIVFYKDQIHAATKELPFSTGAPFSKSESFDAYADYQKPSSLIGEEWTMRAYETGYIGLTPNESKEKNPVWPMTNNPPWSRPFTSEIIAEVTSKKHTRGSVKIHK